MATIGKVGLAMDVDSSDTTERDGAATTAAGGDGGDDDNNGRAPRRRLGLSGVRAERGGGARRATPAQAGYYYTHARASARSR